MKQSSSNGNLLQLVRAIVDIMMVSFLNDDKSCNPSGHKLAMPGFYSRSMFWWLTRVLGGAVSRENVGYSIQLIGRRMFIRC